MAIKSGIFNSVNGDRRYKAEDFASYFAKFIGNGVFPNPSNGFQVIANGDMTVSLKAGNAWIFGYYATNDDDYIMALDVADGVLNRIDRIVLQLNYLNRSIVPLIKKGTFASSPVAPALKRDADAYEIALADILINKGVLSITQSNITDTRLNKDLCGIVHGTVEQVDTTTIFNQYQAWFNEFSIAKQAEFNTWKTAQETDYSTWSTAQKNEFENWFTSMQDILSGDVAGNLLNKITLIENGLAAHQADYVKHPGYAVVSGTTGLTITVNPAPLAYVDGMAFSIKIANDSTGPTSLNVNGLGPKTIKKANGNNIAANSLKAGSIYTVRYNIVTNFFILQGEGGSGNAVASDLLSGKTASTDAGDIVGTIPNNGKGNTVIPGTTDIIKPAGYYSTPITIQGDPDKIAANIKKDVTIDNVLGTLLPQFGNMTLPYSLITTTLGAENDNNRYRMMEDGTVVRIKGTYVSPNTVFVKEIFDKEGTLISSTNILTFSGTSPGYSLLKVTKNKIIMHYRNNSTGTNHIYEYDHNGTRTYTGPNVSAASTYSFIADIDVNRRYFYYYAPSNYGSGVQVYNYTTGSQVTSFKTDTNSAGAGGLDMVFLHPNLAVGYADEKVFLISNGSGFVQLGPTTTNLSQLLGIMLSAIQLFLKGLD